MTFSYALRRWIGPFFLHPRVLPAFTACALLTGCAADTSGADSSTVTIAIAPQPAAVPVGSSTTFTASVSGSSQTPLWGIIQDTGTDTGSYTQPSPTGNSGYLHRSCHAAGLYLTTAFNSSGDLPQGAVDLHVYVPPSPTVTCGLFGCPIGTTQNILFYITAPSRHRRAFVPTTATSRWAALSLSPAIALAAPTAR